MIKNTPEKYVGDYAVKCPRDASENIAKWYFFLVKEGLEKGLPFDFARDAMRESGRIQFQDRFCGLEGIDAFAKEFMTFTETKAYEGEVSSQDEDHVCVQFGYCPMVNAWSAMTEDEALIASLCDSFHEKERTIADLYGLSLDLKETIAAGCGKCRFCFHKKP